MDKYQNGDVTNLTPETESWTDFLKKSFGWNRPPVPTVAKKFFKAKSRKEPFEMNVIC